MTVIELFAGAGGASLGLLRAGFTEVRAVEWDASACATRRAAGLRCDEGDVRDPKHYEGVTADAVWSSFPCQAWSTAGKRLGKDDPRNGWPWTVDVLDQVKPRWFMAENVPGLTHHRGACNGRCADDCARLYFEQTILRELRERFAWVDYRILDAARFGVAQNRERLIIVAGPHAIDWPKETHAPPEELRAGSLFGDGRKPWRTVREALGLGGALRRVRGAGMCERHGERPDHSVDDPAPTINAGSVIAADNGGKGCGQWSASADTRSEWEVGTGIRRLTPAECAILQDFPPDHPWQGTKTSIYAQIGNAVPSTLAFVIGRAVMATASAPL